MRERERRKDSSTEGEKWWRMVETEKGKGEKGEEEKRKQEERNNKKVPSAGRGDCMD